MVSTPRQNIDLYVLGLLCLSLGANVLLGIRVLRSGPAGPIQFRQPNGWIALAEGTPVPVLVGRSADGRPRRIDFALDHRQTVLYVYANTCIWCDRNADSLAALVAQRRENYRFIALNISPEQSDSADSLPKEMIELRDLSAETIKAYKLGSTPQTLVISCDGKVLKNWVGAYVGKARADIQKFFSVKLPSIAPH